MDKFFKISERNSTVRTEVVGGITTFFTMAYIVFVNPNCIAANGATGWLAALGADSATLGQIWNAVFISSILVAVIGTLIMGLYAKLPYAIACGMGFNSFFCTYFISGAFLTGIDLITGYHSGMVILFLSGCLFLLLSFTGAREYIAKSLPDCLKRGVAGGIGLFIAYIGFQNAGIIQDNAYTLTQFVDIHTGDWINIVPALTALIGLVIIGVLSCLNIKGSVIISIFASTIIYYILMGTVPSFELVNIKTAFSDFKNIAITGLFDAEAWKVAFSSPYIGGVFESIILIITLCLTGIFSTIGTVYGGATQSNMLDENGDPIDIGRAFTGSAISFIVNAVLGTSTCTTFVESSAGIVTGARTGLASVVTAICFAACIFLSPIASIIPTAATAPALIYVGILMAKSFLQVDLDDMRSAIPGFLSFIMMLLTYSVVNGIGVAVITYVLITLFTGKFKKKDLVTAIIAVLFIFKFIFVTL